MIEFYSTLNPQLRVSLEEAVMKGLADDTGLFMPVQIPIMPKSFFERLHSLSFHEIAYEVAHTLLQGVLDPKILQNIIDKAFFFDAPLKKLSDTLYTLELFHGPTLSFKDFGAQFMAQLMGHFVSQKKQKLKILVATSGDTGSAIAQAFYKVPHIQVYILYPQGRVSVSQEKQLTTLGHNIKALEIQGSFDDCQRLVKEAFADKELRKITHLTSANSINIARLIPQSFYYFYAYAQLEKTDLPVVVSVPSGNFGNLSAGLIAQRMGLPIDRFVAATNINDTVPHYLKTGHFQSKTSQQTLSNAMDVGNPSNFARMQDLFHQDWEVMKSSLYAASFTDSETEEAMRVVLKRYNYLMDPHGAVGYLGLTSYKASKHETFRGIFLETADPSKFADDVERITGQKARIPKRLQAVLTKKKESTLLKPNYDIFKQLLLKDL